MEIEFERSVCLELYAEYRDLGRFMLRNKGHTIAAGLIEEVSTDQPQCFLCWLLFLYLFHPHVTAVSVSLSLSLLLHLFYPFSLSLSLWSISL